MKKYIYSFIIIFLIHSCATKKSLISKTTEINKWIKPPNLKKGDTIAIVSPASYLKDSLSMLTNAIDSLNSWSLNYKIYPHVFDIKNRFAGKDQDRALDFQKAINNPNIKAIWCARGGYGSVRILDKLNLDALTSNPKWIIGYSDITAIHNKLHNFGIQSIHGVMPVSFIDTTKDNSIAIKSLKNVLFGKNNTYKIKSSSYNKVGATKGVLVGGNLTLLHTMLGSKTSIHVKNKILFIEDIGEYTYHIDRMLYSLKRAGYFDNCKGLIVGKFANIKENTPAFCKNLETLILDIVDEYDFPVVFNFPTGHITDNRAMVIGSEVNLRVKKDIAVVEFFN